ncbi:hypothetical protein D046_9021, partial [Vibrio parahaemolyticus V-223/04]
RVHQITFKYYVKQTRSLPLCFVSLHADFNHHTTIDQVMVEYW